MYSFCKEQLQFPSADGKNTIAAFQYSPADKKACAVLQLSHGMCEYVCRYEPMIDTLTSAGIAVCGNDHLGHGHSVKEEDYGFIAEKDGYKMILQDLHQMNTHIHQRYPNLPVFLLGHSMGSFYAREYAREYPQSIDALIISGTGGPTPILGVGKKLAEFLSKLKGPRYQSDLMVKLSTGSYCKGIEQEGSPHAWLSRDPAVWDAYAKDPMCTFTFTVSAYRDMLTMYDLVSSKKWAEELQKSMPILLVSGDRDPVGNYGKGVRDVETLLKNSGISDLTTKLYPDCRHELHNEINKSEYLEDLIEWVKKHLVTQ